MNLFKNLLLIAIIAPLLFCPSVKAQVAIKGISIDMSIDEAAVVVNERFSRDLGQTYKVAPGKVASMSDLIVAGGNASEGFQLVPDQKIQEQQLTEAEKLERGLAAFAALGALAGAPSAFIVEADAEKKVEKVVFPATLSNDLFNTEDMQASDFAQEIANNYSIPSMSPFMMNVGDASMQGWEFSSPEGFRLRVFEDKSIEMIRIPKREARSFD